MGLRSGLHVDHGRDYMASAEETSLQPLYTGQIGDGCRNAALP